MSKHIYNENILKNDSTSASVLIVDAENPPESGGGGSGSGGGAGYNPQPPSDNEAHWQEVIPNYNIAKEHQQNIQDENRSITQTKAPLFAMGLLAYFILA
mgnify:CR=1 FL=1